MGQERVACSANCRPWMPAEAWKLRGLAAAGSAISPSAGTSLAVAVDESSCSPRSSPASNMGSWSEPGISWRG
ncbi:MAG: hypothetical protein R2711_02000 [Acidimicrobiales bacterium]